MTEKKVPQESIEKALTALSDVAKSVGAGTAVGKDPAMVGEAGSPQIFHTSANSEPKSWAGSTKTDVPNNGIVDVAPNGTDYKVGGSSAVVKSVLSLLKAGKITPEAAEVLLSKAMEQQEPDGDEEDPEVKKGFEKEDEKEEDDVAKSLAANEDIAKGFEVSDFLRGFGTTFAKSISALQAEVKALRSELSQNSNKGQTFNKSLAEAVVVLGNAISAQGSRIDSLSQTPARGPKSVQVLEKSFNGQNPETPKFTKSQIINSATDLVQKGQLSAHTVLKLESNGSVSEHELSLITANIK